MLDTRLVIMTMPPWDLRICPPEHRALGQEPPGPKCVLVEWIGRDWETNNNSVIL